MTTLVISQMGGLAPSIPARSLADSQGQTAENLQPMTAEFRPTKDDTKVASGLNANNPKTLYRFDRTKSGALNTDETSGWIGAAAKVSFVRQQLNNDTTGRIYYTDDDAPSNLYWHDASGANGIAAVPAPTQALALELVESYLFTEEVKNEEFSVVNSLARDAVLNSVTATMVGLGRVITPESKGWIKSADFGGLATEVVRMFAVDPNTKQIIDTYCSMTPTEAAWVLSPVLGGYYATTPANYSPPAWAAMHSAWWVIPVKGFAHAYTVDKAKLSADLAVLEMPGTQGEKKLLTADEVAAIADGVASIADANGTQTASMIAQLEGAQAAIDSYMNLGGSASLDAALKAFYNSVAVKQEIEAAKDVFAEEIWALAELIATSEFQEKPRVFDSFGGA